MRTGRSGRDDLGQGGEAEMTGQAGLVEKTFDHAAGQTKMRPTENSHVR